MKEDRGLQVDTTGEQPLFVRDFHTPANARPGMLSPLNARGPYSPVPTHLRKQYVEKMYEIFQLADETHSGVAELKKCLHIAEHQFAKEVVTLNHEHYAFSYEKLLTFDEFMIIADEVIPMRELYFFVISGDLFDDRDEKVEEITSGLAHVPEKEHAELVKNAAPLTKSGKEKLVKVSIEDLSALPLHYGVERYDCAKCGITAENMMANYCYVGMQSGEVLCSICGSVDQGNRLNHSMAVKQTERRSRPVKPTFMPPYLVGYLTPAEVKAEKRKGRNKPAMIFTAQS